MNSPIDLLHSDLVTRPTRDALRERLAGEPALVAAAPLLLDRPAFATLCAVVERLIPQDPAGPRVPVAAWMDERAAVGGGDGWRYDALPPDDVALKLGIARLESESLRRHGRSFVELAAADQDALLSAVQDGEVDWPGCPPARWFEELLATAVLGYVANPLTLEAMRFDALAFLPRQDADDIGLNAPAAGERR